jgi:predicted PurR-regulated permease PerM
MQFSFQKAFYIVATVIGLFAILILAKTVLIPIAFAFLIAFILVPVTQKFESWGTNEIVSALIPILGFFLILGGTIFLFSNQLIQLSEHLTDFKVKILNIFAEVTLFINNNIEFLPNLEKGAILDKFKVWFNGSVGSLLGQTFSSTASFIFGLVTTTIFTFLILIYRKGLIQALIHFYPKEHRANVFKMFKSLQQVGQQYLSGMMMIVLIVGFVNSLGLWIIGIDNPFLFGFLAAILALIPYAGTLLGATIPVLYSLISHDSLWIPVSIAIVFWLVQMIESNFLTPKFVGGSLKINAFASILSIIVGASVWGIAGMILFLPFTAMLKTVCEEYVELRPLALLIGENHYETKEEKGKWFGKYFTK